MNTFLPHHPTLDDNTGQWSFSNTAEVLDKKHLNKQSLEASQILDILCGKYADGRYNHHPAVLQWKGHEWVLLDYLTDICLECRSRKMKNTIFDRVTGYNMFIPHNSSMELPEWMNRLDFFASHRSRLLFKGRCDSALQSLKETVQLPKDITLRFWLISGNSTIDISNEYVKKKQMQIRDIEQIEDYLFKLRVNISPNFYSQYKWTEPDNIPYVWPVTIAAIREQAILDRENMASRDYAG